VSAHVASVVGIARAGSNKGQIGGAGTLHAPERFEPYIPEGLAWVPFYNEDTDIRANELRSVVVRLVARVATAADTG
jgi:hypothetical protein